MYKLVKRLSSQLWVSITWTLLVIVLLCLPGSEFPKQGVFQIKHLDKLIHLFLFGNFVFLWSSYVYRRLTDRQNWYKYLIIITLIAILFGIIMEFVQVNYIPLRSFEWADIWADSTGSVLAALLMGLWGRQWGLLDQ